MRDYLPPAARAARLKLMQNLAASHGGRCTATEYIHCNTPLTFDCPVHGPFEAQPRHIATGSWCRQCRNDARKPPVIERLQRYVRDKGGKIKTPYISARARITIECPIHGDWQTSPDNLLNKKSWCARCARGMPRRKRKNACDAVVMHTR